MSKKNNGSIMRALFPRQLIKAMSFAHKSGRSMMVHGQPGIGKSDLAKKYADIIAPLTAEERAAGKTNIIDIRLSQMEPTDVRGIPVPVTDPDTKQTTCVWAIPSMYPDADFKGVMLFDELNSAMPVVLAAAYQIILDHKIGDYVIPEDCFVMAAGNRDSDGGVTFTIPTPLRNRFIHVEMKVNLEHWMEDFAIPSRLHADVISFLRGNPDVFNKFDPADPSLAFATPRTWHFVSDLLKANEDEMSDVDSATVMYTLIGGTVGEGVAAQFRTFHQMTSKNPAPIDVLTGKVTKTANKQAGAMYAMANKLAFQLAEFNDQVKNKELDKETYNKYANNFITFIDENYGDDHQEIVIYGMKNAQKVGILFRQRDLPAMKQFVARHGDLIQAAQNISAR